MRHMNNDRIESNKREKETKELLCQREEKKWYNRCLKEMESDNDAWTKLHQKSYIFKKKTAKRNREIEREHRRRKKNNEVSRWNKDKRKCFQ